MKSQSENSKRFVVIDRDGVIFEDRDHLTDPNGVALIPEVGAALQSLRNLGFGIVVATNQSVIGRGWLDRAGLDQIHKRMHELLKNDGAAVDAIYFCPHTSEDGCDCRKPATGLMTQASRAHSFSPKESFVVGDKVSDIEFGKRTGATTFLVRTGYGRDTEKAGDVRPDYVVDDLKAAAEKIRELVSEAM